MVFTDLYAPWCGPCKIMVPALDTIEQEMKNSMMVVKIDADENLQLMKEYNINALPYILVLKKDKLVFGHEGFMDAAEMRRIIRKYYEPG